LISNNTLDKFQIKGPYLFSSGRIIPDKRFDLLLEAYAKSKQQIPLIISGKGSELNNLNRLAEQLSIKDKVKFVGFVTTEELQNLYSSAQCYVMPTPEEDFGLTTAEAISCGSPLIVWDDDGGSCEQCIDGINGYKAKPYDTLNMANKIDQCISDKFKQSHEKEIKESSYKFSEEGQRSVFLIAIKEVLNKK
jgi:glycosyltransferase involved in cell wall biosynthesis